MAITINSVAITDEYTGNQNGGADTGITTLLGAIGDKMWAKITFEVHTETLNIPMTLTANTITRNDCGPTAGSFINDGFQIGMDINIIGTGYYYATNTVITAVTATTMTISGTIVDIGSFPSISIYDVTPIPKMDFYHNCVGINEGKSFKSLSDINNTQKFTASWTTTPSNVNMSTVGASIAWYGGNIPVINYVGAGPLNAYSRQYTIITPFFIKPFALSGQIGNLINTFNGTPDLPVPWLGLDCLSFLYQIDVHYSKIDPTVNQTTGPIETPGNTGWYDEFLNGGSPNYTFTSIAYSVGGNSVSQIDPNNNTLVQITINSKNAAFRPSSTGPPFAPIVLNFCKVPVNQAAYQNTSTNFRQDFIHDRAFQKIGSGAVNGDQFGTGYQVITNYTIVYNSNSSVTVTFTTNMGATAKAAFANSTDSYYLIWVTPQDRSVNTLATTDRNAVLCDINQAITNTDNSSLLTISTDSTTDVHFFNSPDVNINPQTDFKGMQGEYSYFKCDFLVPVATQINDINIRFQSVLYNTSISDKFSNIISTVDLETFLNNTIPSFDGYTNNINISVPTNFPLPATDPRSFKSIQRKQALDGSGLLGYEILYGFQVGYQYFQNNPNGVSAFQLVGSNLWSGYYSSSSFNGGTLPANTGVRTDLLITWDILDPATNLVTQFNRRCSITPGDTGQNTNNVVSLISTYDLLGVNMNQWVANDQITKISCEFYAAPYAGAFPSPPANYSYRATFSIWYDNGSIQTLDIADTQYPMQDGSLWLGQPTIDQSVLGQITVNAYFDGIGQNFNSYRLICNLSYVHN